jgi:5-oxoprolinase (ATP-hydrolysing) subunit C
MSIRVLAPGLHSLLVDRGRPSARAFGLPLGGAADTLSYTFSNLLLGNSVDDLALEITLLGPTLQFEHPMACVVFGAPFQLKSSATKLREVGKTFTAEPGEILTIGGTATGVRGYLAVQHGFQSPIVMGSRSALSPIKLEDQLRCQPTVTDVRSLPIREVESPTDVLRVLPGPQRDWFDEQFFQNQYTVSPASNRMGLRLLGEPISRRPGELASEAVAPGAIQITNDGLPIILGVDGQTIGGYPKVAHVIAADLPKLGQLRPGNSVRFELVTLKDAANIWNEQQKWLHTWAIRLRVATS